MKFEKIQTGNNFLALKEICALCGDIKSRNVPVMCETGYLVEVDKNELLPFFDAAMAILESCRKSFYGEDWPAVQEALSKLKSPAGKLTCDSNLIQFCFIASEFEGKIRVQKDHVDELRRVVVGANELRETADVVYDVVTLYLSLKYGVEDE